MNTLGRLCRDVEFTLSRGLVSTNQTFFASEHTYTNSITHALKGMVSNRFHVDWRK